MPASACRGSDGRAATCRSVAGQPAPMQLQNPMTESENPTSHTVPSNLPTSPSSFSLEKYSRERLESVPQRLPDAAEQLQGAWRRPRRHLLRRLRRFRSDRGHSVFRPFATATAQCADSLHGGGAHQKKDCGGIVPSVSDWLSRIRPEAWMSRRSVFADPERQGGDR